MSQVDEDGKVIATTKQKLMIWHFKEKYETFSGDKEKFFAYAKEAAGNTADETGIQELYDLVGDKAEMERLELSIMQDLLNETLGVELE